MAYRSTPVPAALAAAIRRVVQRFLAQLRHARVGLPGGVHQARVASRRLREVLPVLARCTGAELREVRRGIRRLARAMGRARELDVLHALVHTHPVAADWPRALRQRVDRALRTDRAAAQDRLLERLHEVDVPAAGRALRAAAAAMLQPAAARCATDALGARRRQRAEALGAALADLGTVYAPASLHTARIAVKKLRYSLEWARPGGPPALPAQLAELKAAQEILGQIQDLHTLEATLRRLAAGTRLDRSTIRALHEASARIDVVNRQLHARFLARVSTLKALTGDLARTTPLSWIRRRPLRAGARSLADRGRRPASAKLG